MGRSQEEIKQLLEEDTEAAGMVVGDETRLRQIVTNLARWAYLLPFVSSQAHFFSTSVMLASSHQLAVGSASKHD